MESKALKITKKWEAERIVPVFRNAMYRYDFNMTAALDFAYEKTVYVRSRDVYLFRFRARNTWPSSDDQFVVRLNDLLEKALSEVESTFTYSGSFAIQAIVDRK